VKDILTKKYTYFYLINHADDIIVNYFINKPLITIFCQENYF